MAVSVHCSPPQPILLIYKGFLNCLGKPFLMLGQFWDRNYVFLCDFRPTRPKQFTQTFLPPRAMLWEAFEPFLLCTPQSVETNRLNDPLSEEELKRFPLF